MISVGLYKDEPEESIVEECFSTYEKLKECQPAKTKVASWAEIVKGGKSKAEVSK